MPDSGTGLSEWWDQHGINDDSWAAATYCDLIGRAGPAGERHATTIALSLDLSAASRQVRTQGGGLRGAVTVLRQDMTALAGVLHYLPVRGDQAARDLRKKKTELLSDAHQRSRIGQIEDAGATAEYDDLLHQEADLTAGYGVLRAIGSVCVTAPTVEDLDAAVESIEQAASQSSCQVRRLVSQQAQAFTAAAPLCRSV